MYKLLQETSLTSIYTYTHQIHTHTHTHTRTPQAGDVDVRLKKLRLKPSKCIKKTSTFSNKLHNI